MTAIGVQVSAGPRFQWLVGVGRVGKLALLLGGAGIEPWQRFAILLSPADKSRLRQRDELTAPANSWSI